MFAYSRKELSNVLPVPNDGAGPADNLSEEFNGLGSAVKTLPALRNALSIGSMANLRGVNYMRLDRRNYVDIHWRPSRTCRR